MVYYNENEWNIPTLQVTYKENGKTVVKTVGSEGKEWWIEFAEKWTDVGKIKFDEITPTDIQIKRLTEVNGLGIGDGFSELITNYVMENQFPDNLTHKLREIQIEKEKGTVQHEINLRADVDYLSIMTGVEL